MKLGRYIIGLLSGLTFGMLFAPKKGNKLRSDLMRKGSTGGHEALGVLVDAFRDAGAEAVTEMKKLSENEQISAALSMSKDKMKEYLAQLEDTGYDIAAQAQGKMAELKEMAEDTGSTFKKRAVAKQVKVVRKAKQTVGRAKKAVSMVKRKVAKPAKTTAVSKTAKKKAAPRSKAGSRKK